MRMIKSLLDKIIFASGVLLFMQVPHFIDQYEQRLGGYYQAQVKQLQLYQEIADRQHGGDLMSLIKDFESSASLSVQQTATTIRLAQQESLQLENDVQQLASGSVVEKIVHMASHLKIDIARAVIITFKPAFPLSIEGLLCGLLGGLFMSMLFNGLLNFPSIFNKKKSNKSTHSHVDIKQRVEPTIMRTAKAA